MFLLGKFGLAEGGGGLEGLLFGEEAPVAPVAKCGGLSTGGGGLGGLSARGGGLEGGGGL